MAKNDLTNQRFGRLTVLGDVGKRTANGKVLWHCLCDCGTITFVRGDHLKNGKIQSCGCLNDDKKRSRFKDLAGIETENFKIIDRAYSENQRVCWNCICKHCGNHVIYNSNEIERNRGCGCRQNRSSKERMDEIRDPESLKTTKPTTRSTTGVRGVYYRKNRGVYQAFINVDKKQVYLGSSKNFDKAVKMRRDAEREYGYK